MISKPKTFKRLSIFLLGLVISTSGFAFKVQNSTPVNGQEPTEKRIEEGSTLFGQYCAACHKLESKLIGPALTGVLAKYDYDFEYVIKWVQNNQALISSGDPRAVAASEIDPSAMTNFGQLNDDQVTSILMYIENGGDGDAPAVAADGANAAPVAVDESVFTKINWAIVILSILVFIIIVLMVGILELVTNVTGRQIVNWNNVNAFMMLIFVLLFFALSIYEYTVHAKYLLPEASSKHGIDLDKMMTWTYAATLPVFFITQFLLFYFSFRYRQKPGRKAYYYPHNNKLEYIWTFIPAVVLTVLVLGGLKSWKQIVKTEAPEGSTEIEIFAYQFGWQARYAGADQTLGYADYNLISDNNPLGVANMANAKALIASLEEEIAEIEYRITKLDEEEAKLRASLGGRIGDDRKDHLKKINSYASGEVEAELRLTIRRRHTQIERIKTSIENKANVLYNGTGDDDMVVPEIHLVIDQPVTLKFRARDVIHSAYMPYFRAQMNVVPGLPTQFTFTPTKTSKEMREIKNDPSWDYYLVCNKICGNAHFNMKIKIVVEDQQSFDEWMSKQSGLFVKAEPATSVDESAETGEDSAEELTGDSTSGQETAIKHSEIKGNELVQN